LELKIGSGIYRASPQETLSGSVAAAYAMRHTFCEQRRVVSSTQMEEYLESPARMGIFICQCGDHIAGVVDTDALRRQSAALPGVIHAAVISQACLPQVAESVGDAVVTHGLNRVLLAACACCSLDQVCFSCTYQRVRCKDNLGLFAAGASTPRIAARRPSGEDLSHVIWEFVNIREHCAWVHADDPKAATAKADALIASAAVKLNTGPPRRVQPLNGERSALILGNSAAAQICQNLLKGRCIVTHVAEHLPHQIWRTDGHYAVSNPSTVQHATAIVLAPQDSAEADLLCNAFATSGGLKRLKTISADVGTSLPGVFFCDPPEGQSSGAAAAVKVAGWLDQLTEQSKPIVASVDPYRCRACKTCIEICELGAPQLVGEEPQRHSWIDPTICSGCASCAALCPSGAITAGYSTDEQLEAMLAAVLKDNDINIKQKAVVFTCNWSAYLGLEAAGRHHTTYAPWVYPIKVMCMGRLSPGIILKTFNLGAEGVLLLGCPPDECHYEFGSQRAKDTFDLTRKLMQLLGYSDKCLVMDWVAAGDEKSWVTKLQTFVDGLNEDRKHPG
jgi:coenzyme F420-reducing hydrogenase delta subunit/ferredoxin